MENSKTGLKRAEWFIVTTFGSHENRVAQNIINRIESFNLTDYVFDAISAEETVLVEGKDGKPKEKKENLYKGFVFVHMIMTDESWYMVRNTPGVTGICGSSGRGTKPTPVPKSEMNAILKRLGRISEEMINEYEINDTVKIINGPFYGLEGVIKSINRDTKMFQVEVTHFFGQASTADVSFADVEKVKTKK